MRRPIPSRDPESSPDHGPVGSVAGVVTAFQPEDELTRAVEAVRAQVGVVVVVLDEADPSATTRAVLDACRALGADVVLHGDNRGIGAALNTGIARARELLPTTTHVLTLDQDSAVPAGYTSALLAAGAAADRAGVPVGMLAPDTVGSIVRLPGLRHRQAPGGVVIGDEPIQSGLLVPVTALDAVGGFDEGLFIDGVDTDFYLRASDLGLRCVVAPGIRLEHRLGRAITLGSGRELPLLVAATFRYHYQWRNLVALLSSHARRHPVWAGRAVVRSVRHLVIVTALAPGRLARLREAARGAAAGVRGETGKRPD
ncbi:hypothetical protein GCM10011376_32030 [Nocardioides flavus (ex Wang et al. 2016)]|uniref:Glycosyltransferase 2-like domain-containing protein n=1 Tax=Nocardioides flavus (ex Wang et al. 2016) TaxID=2058780 RepID=A0ABQ3HLN7_9ACTN|nr:glycosyltransferase [Nocardioides flavus (ex Wang et al. 2016)]GHE18593.1 hypothetical protein GCM10011376_32030 [Nocardioides flavus (ex Wang et al. 2016)]